MSAFQPIVTPFVDHYEILHGDPSTPLAQLRRKYIELLRSYHPDKRQTGVNGLGHRMTLQLNEAWAILGCHETRKEYDVTWLREQSKADLGTRPRTPPTVTGNYTRPKTPGDGGRPRTPCDERPRSARPRVRKSASQPPPDDISVEACRQEGNELYKAANALIKATGYDADTLAIRGIMPAAAEHKYKSAIDKYSTGIETDACDYRLYSNRARCYAALAEWTKCQMDARKATELKPSSMKAWYFLVKALIRDGLPLAASRELENALKKNPDSTELQALQSELSDDIRIGGPKIARDGPLFSARNNSKSSACAPAPPPPPQSPPPPCFPPPANMQPSSRPSSAPPSNKRFSAQFSEVVGAAFERIRRTPRLPSGRPTTAPGSERLVMTPDEEATEPIKQSRRPPKSWRRANAAGA